MRENQPFFSIIVPTFNRPTQLTACLQSVTHLDYERNRFEVIVVNDRSVMPPKDIVSSFCHQLTVTLIVSFR
jgi:cellulose synthase/poly-beta-1,6-N-acetylglucosamine synthase-like glycosyltransferase